MTSEFYKQQQEKEYRRGYSSAREHGHSILGDRATQEIERLVTRAESLSFDNYRANRYAASRYYDGKAEGYRSILSKRNTQG